MVRRNSSGIMDVPFMQGQLVQAKRIITELRATGPMERALQVAALRAAKGVVFMTQLKAGFVFSGTVAAGFIICKTADGCST